MSNEDLKCKCVREIFRGRRQQTTENAKKKSKEEARKEQQAKKQKHISWKQDRGKVLILEYITPHNVQQKTEERRREKE